MPTALFVAHSFPPMPGSGSIRALKFARYLPSFGWRPVILTVDRRCIARPDSSLEQEVPPWLPIYRARSLERPRTTTGEAASKAATPFRPRDRPALSALKRTLAHAVYFPDAHNSWLPDAVRQGWRAVRREQPDVLYSSAAPFTNHLVALILHLATRLPLVVELRDGWQRWNQAIYPDYPAWRGVVEGALERVTFRHAARVVLVTEQSARAFREQYPRLPASVFQVVPNGFDGRDLPGWRGDATEDGSPERRFTIVHAGSLYYGRRCADVLEAVGQLARARPDFAAAAKVRLIGTFDQAALAEIDAVAKRYDLDSAIERLPYMEHAELLPQLRRASVLWLIVNTTEGGGSAVPGKLYEYLAARRPILCVAPPGAEAAAIVERTRAGVAVPAGACETIASALSRWFDEWRAGALVPRHDLSEVAQYERSRLTRQLADLFEESLRQTRCGHRR